MAAPLFAAGLSPSSAAQLSKLSLEDLTHLEVSTVSRKTEQWWSAPGAIDVVTEDEIRRSGILNLPDALRLATGVHVGQANAREWAVAIRGFNVNASNKLNVQLDGRSLFTPFFSGVLWDAQDTMLEDVSRIEVVRGPSGALWGAHAVNGFIQIITKPAWETQGLLTTAGSGTDLPVFGAVRYGGKLTDDTFYRVYAKYSQFDWTYTPGTNQRAAPATDLAQVGFRSDTRAAGGATFTLSGDAYTNKGTPKDDHLQNDISGANLTANWHAVVGGDSDLRGTAYYDFTSKRFTDPFDETRHTLSASLRYHLAHGHHDLQFGADGLYSWDAIEGGVVYLRPAKRDYYNTSFFAHDTLALVPNRWAFSLGAQALYTSFSKMELQPTVRLAYTPNPRTTVWGAVSRAVRPPVRLDVDLVAQFGNVIAFAANEAMRPESVIAYELGARRKFSERLAMTLATFLNHYDNIRSYESATPVFQALPWTFKNTTNVDSSGVEAAIIAQPAARVFVKASYRYLETQLTNDPGSGDFENGFFEANDPRHVAVVTTRFDLPAHVEFDVSVRHASSLPNPAMHAFTTCDARLGWTPRPGWELALIGRNLSDPRHPEFRTANHPNDEVGRSLTVKATWRY